MSSPNSAPSKTESSVLTRTTSRPGDVFGRYQLILPVASGGMGTVWAARQQGHPQFRKLVALKIAHENLTLDDEYRKMFLDEARLASAIQHPNVCSVLDMGENGNRLFLTMEWMGGSLRELLVKVPNRAVAPNIGARIIADACAGLHAAHELCDDAGHLLELIHRDISPDNILFAVDGRVKVTDFGIARARDQMHKRTATGEMKGKISYMAPEQIKSRTYDRRVDVFALGCVLYRATVGRKAFDGSSATVIYDILESRFLRPHEVKADFPPSLEAIILKAMAVQPDDRYATSEEMGEALEAWLVETKQPTTSAQVGAVVREVLGLSLAERSERIRAATSEIDSAEAAKKSGDGGIPVVVEEAEEGTATRNVDLKDGATATMATSTTARTGALSRPKSDAPPPRFRQWRAASTAGTAGLLLAGLLGTGALAMSRRTTTPTVAPPTSQSTAVTTSSDVPSAPPVAQGSKPETISFFVGGKPDNARVSIDDGAPRPFPLHDTLPKDPPGASKHKVTITAAGHKSEVRYVDFETSKEIQVSLQPIAAGGGNAVPAVAHPPTHETAAKPADPPPPVTAQPPTTTSPTATPTPSTTASGKKVKKIERDLEP